jgi:hypothetical protein
MDSTLCKTAWVDSNRNQRLLYLNTDNNGRNLNLNYRNTDNRWNAYTRFAARRKTLLTSTLAVEVLLRGECGD